MDPPPPPLPPRPTPPPPPSPAVAPGAWETRPPPSAGMATAALVCGIAGLVLFFVLAPSVVAVVLGFVAADRARKHPHPGDGRGRATAGWILGVIGLLGFVALMVGVAVTGGFEDNEIAVLDLDVGDCVDVPDDVEAIEEVTRRECAELHQAEVYLVAELSFEGDDYPGLEAVQTEVDDLCAGEAFEDYVGRDFPTSRYSFYSLVPVEEGWELGDRDYVCLVITPELSRVTGSVRGSGD